MIFKFKNANHMRASLILLVLLAYLIILVKLYLL